jgi:hypothetical protein
MFLPSSHNFNVFLLWHIKPNPGKRFLEVYVCHGYVLLRITKQKHIDVRRCVWFHSPYGILVDAEFWMGFAVSNNAIMLSCREWVCLMSR